jgi:hypothetical protein
MQFYER